MQFMLHQYTKYFVHIWASPRAIPRSPLASPADGILNTAAGLLALRRHLEVGPTQDDWEIRSRKAALALQQMLEQWDVLGSDQVGFEMLMVQHLSLLQLAGVELVFRQQKELQAIYDAKRKVLSMSSLYEAPSTMLHSLEAFIGHAEFDRLRGFQDENGSMMGSPSSTAAYLMHVSSWDDDSELYLRNVVYRGVPHDGGVPSAWPTTVFEASWHRNEMYWKILLVQAFALLCNAEGEDVAGNAVHEANPLLKEQIPMISCQILAETLAHQHSDRSWDSMNEVTAYALLALSSIAGLPWVQSLDDNSLQNAINNGKEYLRQHRDEWKRGSHLWIEKVTFASDALSEAYCIAAMAAIIPTTRPDSLHTGLGRFALPKPVSCGMRAATAMIQRTSTQFYRWSLKLADVQACYALLGLQRHCRDFFFPAMEEGKYKYLPMTALIWMACHSRHRSSLSLLDLHEMMVLSMVVYQVDQYVESIIERKDDAWDFSFIEACIMQVCHDHSPNQTLGSPSPRIQLAKLTETLANGSKQAFEDISSILGRVAVHIFCQRGVVDEFRTFLLAHIAQARANRQFRDQKCTMNVSRPAPNGEPSPYSPPSEYQCPSRTFYRWVRTTSADHTSCPLAWTFFNCLLAAKPSSLYSSPSQHPRNVFATARMAYVAEDLCRHLASMCRMYNDFASLKRDTEEANLNSLNFPEFHHSLRSSHGGQQGDGGNVGISNGIVTQENDSPTTTTTNSATHHGVIPGDVPVLVQKMKDDLMWVAEYERRSLDMAVRQMDEELSQKAPLSVEALKVFIDVTDLYGLVYLVKDLTNRVKGG
ncbi:uncharacterized protein PG986_000504 [Apiospora aurea]|uniref:Transcription factor domain-containing protein n=1 Tax=Apiospora aurea TaxID=335848 RepID=A0ABR1QUN7_9PEZI